MKSKKVWYGIGLCATIGGAGAVLDEAVPGQSLFSPVSSALAADSNEAGEGGEAGHGGNVNNYPGELSEVMAKIWAGEGGEGGAGMTHMWPSVRIPALSHEQIESIIPGNTLRNDGRAAMYFAPSGELEGWAASYAELPADQVDATCTAAALAERKYWREDDRCWKININPSSGTWKIDGHQLCTRTTTRSELVNSCWHVAVILDRIGLFDEHGDMQKVGRVIMQGKVLGVTGDR